MNRNIEILEDKESFEKKDMGKSFKKDEKFADKQKEKFEEINAKRNEEDKVEKPRKLKKLNLELEEQKLQDDFNKKAETIKGYKKIEIKIKGTKYNFAFSDFLVDGKEKESQEIKKDLSEGHTSIKSGRIKARIKLQDGPKKPKMSVDIPIEQLLSGNPLPFIKTTCENIFGGALEWYNKNKKSNDKTKKYPQYTNERKDKEVKEAARLSKGLVGILEEEGLTAIIMHDQQGRQLQLSSGTGYAWTVEHEGKNEEISGEDAIEYINSKV